MCVHTCLIKVYVLIQTFFKNNYKLIITPDIVFSGSENRLKKIVAIGARVAP